MCGGGDRGWACSALVRVSGVCLGGGGSEEVEDGPAVPLSG